MNKIANKFMIGIIVVLALSTLSSIIFTQNYAGKYYVSQKTEQLNQVSDQFISKVNQENVEDVSNSFEKNEKVVIVYSNKTNDNDKLNNELRSSFLEKGIGFKKLWLWEDDYETVIDGKNRIKLYEQEKLNYSLLVKYISKEDLVYAIAMIVPNIEDSFPIINTFFAVISSMTIILATVIIIFLVRRIVEPLNKFDLFAKNMGKGEFTPLEVETNDELEKVADTLNQMGTEIVHYQEQLKEKNLQMEELLNNVAHDLKTPISLIKLYSEGINDGLDDGTFLQTIVKESNEMNQMVERLLFISKAEKEEIELREINLSSFVKNRLDTYLIMSNEQKIEIVSRIEDGVLIETNERLLQSIIDNLISNALKYTSGTQVFINLNSVDQKIVFEISNELSDSNLEVEKIWEPYYVGEKSRSKELSGTGLGLYLVKKIVDKLDYEIDCRIKEDKLYFTLMINQ
ncbi:sensor histidine kinase [Vagococcus carniphilus]|uniref:sensor histidine kinase n=1 Tax=Vagococcus carniphilus TaxID=218144 RepID=UPI002891CA6E|nr:HAMP domain-containing sensor histidine kinase [Vagococcus carniphilus]MDT2814574.1 HAMP domain-containing sensor histidine kinase [Vagococcus carniphilus]MDT2864195.1 HAMP domain-containing sensor histidine kinase [Vagococcus carniphilus]